jgi:superfamily I DNA/RNA helicase
LNYRKNINDSYLITFTHTLTYFLEEFAKFESDNEKLNFAEKINNKDQFDNLLEQKDFLKIEEIIIDEAQDIDIKKLRKLKEKFQKISYGADNHQILYPNTSVTKTELENLFTENQIFILHQNFRNSFEILQLTNSIFQNRISQEILDYAEKNSKTGFIPKLIIKEEQSKREEAIIEIIEDLISEEETIGILVPTVNHTSASIDNLKSILENAKTEYSFYDNRDNPKSSELPEIRKTGIKRIHLTTFKSSKGIEFDNVIILHFEKIDFWSKKGNIVTSNDYYVGLTRAKKGLFLIPEFNNIEQSSDFYEVE